MVAVQFEPAEPLGKFGMTIKHYGTPITPNRVLIEAMGGASFCVQWKAPAQVQLCHDLGASVMLDCSAYNAWTSGNPIEDWEPYYDWVGPWLEYPTTWAVIPDEIKGDELTNDLLMRAWPHGREKGAPVYHMHENKRRLIELIHSFPLVCIGSSGDYAVVMSEPWQRRMDELWREINRVFKQTPQIHMMRGMQCLGKRWPFAKVDSTDVARNHNRKHGPAPTLIMGTDRVERARGVIKMRARWDALNCPPRFIDPGEQWELAA